MSNCRVCKREITTFNHGYAPKGINLCNRCCTPFVPVTATKTKRGRGIQLALQHKFYSDNNFDSYTVTESGMKLKRYLESLNPVKDAEIISEIAGIL